MQDMFDGCTNLAALWKVRPPTFSMLANEQSCNGCVKNRSWTSSGDLSCSCPGAKGLLHKYGDHFCMAIEAACRGNMPWCAPGLRERPKTLPFAALGACVWSSLALGLWKFRADAWSLYHLRNMRAHLAGHQGPPWKKKEKVMCR